LVVFDLRGNFEAGGILKLREARASVCGSAVAVGEGGRMPEQEALPAETLRQLHELARLAGVPIDERVAGIICEMLHQHVTPSGVLKLLETIVARDDAGR
jgi:hypothetical protein